MSEIIFLIEDAPEGGYTAQAMNNSIYTQEDSIPELKDNIKDAVLCHFDNIDIPKIIRLHFVHDEVLTFA
jgi:hypothetical protein